MNAGRELDAMVAEKALGYRWEIVPPDAKGENAGRTLAPLGFEKHDGWLPPLGKVHEYWLVPHFSTDMAVALPLLNILKRLPPFNDGSIKLEMRGEKWCCYGFHEDEMDWDDFVAESPAHAICLAVLKAVAPKVTAAMINEALLSRTAVPEGREAECMDNAIRSTNAKGD